MPKNRVQCPSCETVLKSAAGFPAGKSIKCPKCEEVFKVPAADADDDDRDEIDDEDEPRQKKSMKRRDKKRAGQPIGLWLGIGGGVLAIVVVLIIVLGGKKDKDKQVDKPGDPAPQAREGGGSETHTVVRRIETKIALPQREPFVFVRGILSLGGSADGSVIGVANAFSSRQSIINRATGQFISEFDVPEAKPDLHGANATPAYAWQPPLVSPNGKLIIARLVHAHNTITVRDVATGNIVKTLGADNITHFGSVAFSPNSDTLYAHIHESRENVLAGWSVANWQRVCTIKMPENREPSELFPVADGKTVTITRRGVKQPQIDIFDARQQTFVRSIVLASYQPAAAFAVSSDGKLAAIVGHDGVDVHDLYQSKQICSVPQVGQPRFLSNGRLAVIAGDHVSIHDARTGAQKGIWKHDGEIAGRKITHLSFCANGELLIVLDGETATILVAKLKE